MSRIEKWDFDRYINWFRDTISYKLLQHNDDQLLLNCGYEGTGKSTISLATKLETERKLNVKQNMKLVTFFWSEYRDANLQTMLNEFKKKKFPEEVLGDILGDSRYQSDISNVKFDVDYEVESGNIIINDESGTQFFNRSAMARENINMAKLMIANRFLSLSHVLNCPKPMSLDLYIRSQRARGMIWCDASYKPGSTHAWETRVRNVYLYSKSSYNKIFDGYKYWRYFSDTSKLIRKFPPDVEVDRPTNIYDYISEEKWNYYMCKKFLYNIRQVLDMVEDSKQMRVVDGRKLTRVQTELYELIENNGIITMNELVKLTGKAPNNLTTQLKPLIIRGLLLKEGRGEYSTYHFPKPSDSIVGEGLEK